MQSAVATFPDRWDLHTRVRAPDADLLSLQPGRPVELSGPAGSGMTRLGYRMLVETSRTAPVAILDVRGWASPRAAWETGVEHLVVIRCPDHAIWPRVVAALVDGVPAIYAEVPRTVRERDLRRLAALVRSRQSRLVLRPMVGELPSGIGYLRLRAKEVRWEGTDAGHGRLGQRTLVLEASGKGAAGMGRMIEVEDAGTHHLRVVSDLAPAPAGRASG